MGCVYIYCGGGIFQFAAVKGFYHCAELVPGVYQTVCVLKFKEATFLSHRNVTSCF